MQYSKKKKFGDFLEDFVGQSGRNVNYEVAFHFWRWEFECVSAIVPCDELALHAGCPPALCPSFLG